MKKCFLFLFLVLSALSVFPQNREDVLPLPDSLVGRLKEHRKTDVVRAEALDAVIMYYVEKQCVLGSESYINELTTLSDELKDNYWKAVSLYYKSLCAYENYNYSQFLFYVNESLRMINMLRDTEQTQLLATRVYLVKSAFCLHLNQLAESNEYIQKGLQLSEGKDFIQNRNVFLYNYGILLMKMGKNEESIMQFKSLDTLNIIHPKALLNIAISFSSLEQYDSAYFYIDSLIRYAKTNIESLSMKKDLLRAYEVKAGFCSKFGRWDEAIETLESFSYYLNEFEDENLLAAHCLNLSTAYNGNGEYEKALELVNQSIDFSRKVQNIENEWFAVKQKCEILENMKDYEKEVENLRYFIVLTDTINCREDLLKVQEQQYQQETAMLEQQYELQRRASHQRQLIIIILSVVVLIGGLLVALLIWLNRKRLAAELELRNREITAKSMDKIQSNELLNDIIEKLSEMEVQPENNVLPSAIRELKTLVDADTKKDFDLHFVQMHPDFYQKLLADFPKLTQNELRLCAFIKSNLSMKEIAAINGISADSVKTARKRLRKSLNLTGEDTSLLEFLSKY